MYGAKSTKTFYSVGSKITFNYSLDENTLSLMFRVFVISGKNYDDADLAWMQPFGYLVTLQSTWLFVTMKKLLRFRKEISRNTNLNLNLRDH